MKIQDFSETSPILKLEEYFVGSSRAYGLFEDRFGTVRRQFVVDVEGTWDEGAQTLTLVEDFVYADGETEQRTWTIEKTGPDTYEGTCDGVVGVAKGKVSGQALNWEYDFDLKVGNGTWRVHFDDWMFLQPDGVLINKATVTKWGFEIGRVTLVFNKESARGGATETGRSSNENEAAPTAERRAG